MAPPTPPSPASNFSVQSHPAARPRLLARLVAALPSRMGVLHALQLEVLLPVRPLFVQRLGAEADLDPARGAVVAQPGVGHVAEVFAAGDRAGAERPGVDRVEQRRFAAGFDAGGTSNAWGILGNDE